MTTIAKQLEQLQKDKHTLVENLNAVGVEASDDETFTTLAVKVKDAETQGPNAFLTFSNYNSDGFPTKCVIHRYVPAPNGDTRIRRLPENILNSSGPSYNSISELVLPDELTDLGQGALRGMKGLTTFNFPSSITEISAYAFSNCISLKSVTIPEHITGIWDQVFSNCTGLETVIFEGTGKTFYNYYHFSGCSNLHTVILPVDKTYLNQGFFSNCTKLTNVNTWDNVTGMGNYCFQNCTSLNYPSLPENITSINSSCFEGCTKIAFKTIPSGVTTLSNSVFKGCVGLTELTVLGDITTVYEYAFQNCSNLTKLVFPNITTVPTARSTNMFTGTPIKSGTGYIYMPDDLVATAKTTTYWNTFANQIKPISELEAE